MFCNHFLPGKRCTVAPGFWILPGKGCDVAPGHEVCRRISARVSIIAQESRQASCKDCECQTVHTKGRWLQIQKQYKINTKTIHKQYKINAKSIRAGKQTGIIVQILQMPTNAHQKYAAAKLVQEMRTSAAIGSILLACGHR